MIEGFTTEEIADYIDALRRRGNGFAKIPPVRPEPPWSTLSGFADRTYFFYALSRSWPLFPGTGDLVSLFKLFDWSMPVILMPNLTVAIPSDEL